MNQHWAVVLAAGDGTRLASLTSDDRGRSVPKTTDHARRATNRDPCRSSHLTGRASGQITNPTRKAVMRLKRTPGVAVATAAALLFGTGVVSSAFAGDEAKIHCGGVNACKGQSACKSANNACKGQNSCKGKGFLEMTRKECADAQERARAVLQGHE
jgi:hypothetical protein